jgi:hypothetical protein
MARILRANLNQPRRDSGIPHESASGAFGISPYHFGIDQGPVTLMIENYRTGLIWNIMCRCQPIVTGLRKAGFAGGWLQ